MKDKETFSTEMMRNFSFFAAVVAQQASLGARSQNSQQSSNGSSCIFQSFQNWRPEARKKNMTLYLLLGQNVCFFGLYGKPKPSAMLLVAPHISVVHGLSYTLSNCMCHEWGSVRIQWIPCTPHLKPRWRAYHSSWPRNVVHCFMTHTCEPIRMQGFEVIWYKLKCIMRCMTHFVSIVPHKSPVDSNFVWLLVEYCFRRKPFLQSANNEIYQSCLSAFIRPLLLC